MLERSTAGPMEGVGPSKLLGSLRRIAGRPDLNSSGILGRVGGRVTSHLLTPINDAAGLLGSYRGDPDLPAHGHRNRDLSSSAAGRRFQAIQARGAGRQGHDLELRSRLNTIKVPTMRSAR